MNPYLKSFAAVLALVTLAACGGAETAAEKDAPTGEAETPATLSNGMTAKETIEARQANLKKMGKAYKSLRDQTNSGSPDMAAIRSAAATIADKAASIGEWFPKGSSKASGVKTAALDAIWEDPEAFADALARLQQAAPVLKAAANSGDAQAISAAFKETGAACKNCHDKNREED